MHNSEVKVNREHMVKHKSINKGLQTTRTLYEDLNVPEEQNLRGFYF